MRAILHKPDPLPSAHQQLPLTNRYIERDTSESTLDMGRHIVRAFIIMFVQVLALGD